MPEHYFTQNPTSRHNEREIAFEHAGRELRFITDAGTFSQKRLDPGTKLLIDSLPPPARRFLDMGCGWGPVGICMAASHPHAEIIMADINQRSVQLAQTNILRNGLKATVIHSDGTSNIPGEFDLIAINPPIRAGKQAVYALLEQCISRLDSGGALHIVMRKQQGAQSALKFLQNRHTAEVINKSGGYWIIKTSGRLLE